MLTDLGARIVDVRMPDLTGLTDAWFALCASEIVVAHAANYPSRAKEYGPYMREFLGGGCEEPDDGRHVGPGGGVRQLAQPIAADDETRQKIQEDQHAEDDVEPLEGRISANKRRDDDEQYGQDVEGEKRVAEAVRRRGVRVVEVAKALDDALALGLLLLHARAACRRDGRRARPQRGYYAQCSKAA